MLTFHPITTAKKIEEVYNYNNEVFSETPYVSWSIQGLNEELKEGQQIYSANIDDQIVAVLFLFPCPPALYTKNTSIKMEFQGQGHSHRIKDFYEEEARKAGLTSIFHYCKVDDFRMISLNENHGYKKKRKLKMNEQEVWEWEKKI